MAKRFGQCALVSFILGLIIIIVSICFRSMNIFAIGAMVTIGIPILLLIILGIIEHSPSDYMDDYDDDEPPYEEMFELMMNEERMNRKAQEETSAKLKPKKA